MRIAAALATDKTLLASLSSILSDSARLQLTRYVGHNVQGPSV